MTEKVLITGANGFIGSHLTAACLERGMKVHAAIRNTSDMKVFSSFVGEHQNLKLVYPDYQDTQALAAFIKNEQFNFVVHNAGITKTKSEATYNQVNAEMTRNLGHAVAESGIPLTRFIHISSLAAIGPVTLNGTGQRPNPVTGYGRSKLLSEQYLREIKNLPVTVIRPTAVYGPGEKDLLTVFRLLANGWDLNMGSLPQKLSFVYVDDLVAVILLAMNRQIANWLSFDISDGREYDRYALSEAMKLTTGKSSRRIHVPVSMVRTLAWLNEKYAMVSGQYPALNKDKVRELTAENWLCNITPAREILGYEPRFNLDKGLSETIRWYQEHRWL